MTTKVSFIICTFPSIPLNYDGVGQSKFRVYKKRRAFTFFSSPTSNDLW